MREILFRGKRIDNGEWVEGSVVHRTQFYGAPDDCYFILYDGEFHCDYYGSVEVDFKTVGQYTGLTDKNGKKIFEGDIVKLFLKDGIEIGVIGWSDIDLRYKFASSDGNAYGIDVTCEFEIISNIHDSPTREEAERALKEGAEEKVMADRYISEKALIDNIAKIEDLRTLSTKTVGIAISATPTADVEEVRRGEWLEQNLCGKTIYVCSNCQTLGSPLWKRCPVCEVKMGGKNEKL